MSEEAGGAKETPGETDAGAGGGADPQSGAPGGGEAKAWYEGLSEDDQTYLKSKGWDKEGKGPADVLKSYRNLERLRGVDADKLLKLPGNDEEKAAFYARLGVPETPDGYETPDVSVEDTPLDKGVFQKLSHDLKLTPEQHVQFAESVSNLLNESLKLERQQALDRDTAEQKKLESEWGDQKDANYAAAGLAARRFGVDVDAMQKGMGFRATIETLAAIGNALGEGKAPTRDPLTPDSEFGPTPKAAQERLETLKRDKTFRDRLFSGDEKARKQWQDLKDIAFGA